MEIRSRATLILTLLLAPMGSTSLADEEAVLTYDRVRLSASAGTEVDNDTLVAVLYVEREGGEVASLADEVNRTVAWALDLAREQPEVQVQTLDYRTGPVFQKQRVTGWRVRQSLRLESRNPQRISKLLGNLQSRLALQSVGYQVSPEKKAAVEDQLIRDAISAFERRAALVAEELRRPGYRLVSLDVGTTPSPIRPMQVRAAPMAMMESVTPPTLEAGAQRIEVRVSGLIELKLP